MLTVDQVLPVKKQVPLEGLYLRQKLKELARKVGRRVVLTDFLTDKNGVVAKAGKDGRFQVPKEIKNPSDWDRFQELMAQADVTISSGSYFKRLATSQDILYPFEPGNAFETLGQWRLDEGYKQRSPDVAIVTQHLDFDLPEKLVQSGRRISIFTTNDMAASSKAESLKNVNTTILGSGETGVDGSKMIATLADEMGYRVIMMVSGPSVLKILLAAGCLDLLYVTEAQMEIPFDDPATVRTILSGGKKLSDLKDFRLAHEFIQRNVMTESGVSISQSFRKYEAKHFMEAGGT